MQVYYLKKKGVPIGIGTSALTVKFFSFQFMLAFIGTVLWIAYGGYIQARVGSSMWILIIGYVYNAHVRLPGGADGDQQAAGVVSAAAGRSAGREAAPAEGPEGALVKCEDVLETFHSSVMMITRRPVDLLLQLLLAARSC